MIIKLAKSFSVPHALSRAFAVNIGWNKSIRLFLNKDLSFNELSASLKQYLLLYKNPKIDTKLGQYCALLHNGGRWLDLYEIFFSTKHLYNDSLVPEIFGSLYQAEMKCDNSDAVELIKKIKGRVLSPIENRCLSILFEKLNKKVDALFYLDSYLSEKSSLKDYLAIRDKIRLEFDCMNYENSLRYSTILLERNPNDDDIRLIKIKSLECLERIGEAIVRLTIFINETSDPVYKASLYRQRAQLRTSTDLNEKLMDLEMSYKLYPGCGIENEILHLLYNARLYDQVMIMFDRIALKRKIEEDFAMSSMRCDIY